MGAAGFGEGGQALGAVVGTVGSLITGQANAGAAGYNAAVANQNSKLAKQNSAIISQAGQQQTFDAGLRTKQEVGNLRTNEAAGGVDVNSGSAAATQGSAAEVGELNAMTIRSEATKAAYGQDVASTNFQAERVMDEFEKNNAETSGDLNAASTFLGGAGQAANTFANYQLQGVSFTG